MKERPNCAWQCSLAMPTLGMSTDFEQNVFEQPIDHLVHADIVAQIRKDKGTPFPHFRGISLHDIEIRTDPIPIG